MAIESVLANLAVRDLGRAVPWYTALLDGAPLTTGPDVAEWEIGGGSGLQLMQVPQRAGTDSCTVRVADLAAEVARLAPLGLTGPQVVTLTAKLMLLADPDGNQVSLAQRITGD